MDHNKLTIRLVEAHLIERPSAAELEEKLTSLLHSLTEDGSFVRAYPNLAHEGDESWTVEKWSEL